jgi:2-C-methyl-D-erythritol 4-phosphate cytidylyltransferase/2-C-methyl-D-erythritol 2,4-cyclodiphosphate synthase
LTRIGVVIAAGGTGSRFSRPSGVLPKQFLFLDEIIKKFLYIPAVNKIVCVVPGQYHSMFPRNRDDVSFTSGAENRQGSVFNGLKALRPYNLTHVLIHDAARPYFSDDMVNGVVDRLLDGAQAVVPIINPVDSVRINEKSINRDSVSLVQTPQGFHFDLIYELHKKYEGMDMSDDASLCDLGKIHVDFVEGEVPNKKITYKSDLNCCDFRTGFGFDSHEFSKEQNRELKLCGVEIQDIPGLKGISDADVAIHSLIDAILGAMGRGSIGEYFPETSRDSQNADSMHFLKTIAGVVFENSYHIDNIDMTIVCNAPRISMYRQEMTKNIADCLMVNPSSINIKGKTTEGTSITGIAALTNVLIRNLSFL